MALFSALRERQQAALGALVKHVQQVRGRRGEREVGRRGKGGVGGGRQVTGGEEDGAWGAASVGRRGVRRRGKERRVILILPAVIGCPISSPSHSYPSP